MEATSCLYLNEGKTRGTNQRQSEGTEGAAAAPSVVTGRRDRDKCDALEGEIVLSHQRN